jgi:hypothetical protein
VVGGDESVDIELDLLDGILTFCNFGDGFMKESVVLEELAGEFLRCYMIGAFESF